ncbi:DUF6390 family protein [Rhodococcus tibetensis]|uniref:DUF6390 family protein n=1 Tax=Rhodococcus tibetensis TaxID=2965064 RepID=A0ABT1Q7L1_9NOCA|nr:DUF6390 family protein [Rhodococcus sp. FXJ9.536]MCQ4117720.1 DUF6390 family protein [Rhodococcus sp. FXJ9.536]
MVSLEHSVLPGHRLFAQYAHAPNALGYCGPPGSERLQAIACGQATDVDVLAMARQFSGAWPYQQVIAELTGIADQLDERVVRAYWTADELTDRIDRAQFGATLLARLASTAGHYWKHLTGDLLVEAAPTHNFHVFGVYPWSRLLGTGMPQPLRVLEACRISWGEVAGFTADRAVVRSRLLVFEHGQLSLGPEREAPADYTVPEGAFVADLAVGDLVAVHWDFVCDRLDAAQVDRLAQQTEWQLSQTNRRLG